MYTFYFVKFIHKLTEKEFYKFGMTSKDIENRFHPKYDYRYDDFRIQVINLLKSDKSNIEKIEKEFLENYPKNFYVENYLGIKPGYYDNFSGITEVVLLEENQIQEVIIKMQETKESLNLTPLIPTAFITNAGYLSVPQDDFNSITNEYFILNNIKYDINKLKQARKYTDSVDNVNRKLYRWAPFVLKNCVL